MREFADTLDVPVKTVEGWVYSRGEPGPRNRAKLFSLTLLPHYAPKQEATHTDSLPEGEDT